MSDYTQPDSSSNQPSSQSVDNPENPGPKLVLPLPTELVISLTMLPMLAVLVSGQVAVRTLGQIGSSSEELFRGTRLPTLPLLTFLN